MTTVAVFGTVTGAPDSGLWIAAACTVREHSDYSKAATKEHVVGIAHLRPKKRRVVPRGDRALSLAPCA